VILRTSPRTCEQWSLGDLETLRLVLRGGSVIDWRRIHFQTRDDVDRYLRLCLFEPDDPFDRDLVAETLSQQGLTCEITTVETRDGFAQALDAGGFDVILTDDRLPRFDGQSALAMAVERAPHVPFIFVSGTLGEEIAVERLDVAATHGAGCTHSATLAALLARGLGLADAARGAASAAGRAVAQGLVEVGSGEGPVDVLGVRTR